MSFARSEVAKLTPNASDLRDTEYIAASNGYSTVDRARTVLGLTQSEIADALRANESTLHRWRTGASRPTAVYATRLAALNDLVDAIQLLAPTPSEIGRWLNMPDAVFGGRTPRHLIRDGRCEFVLGALAARAERARASGASSSGSAVAESARRSGKAGFQPTARVAAILECATDGFFALDTKARFSYVNRRAAEIFGLESMELTGRRFDEVFPDDAGHDQAMLYARAMADQETATFETYHAPLDVWTEVRALPSQFGLAVFFRDISARKRVEARLRNSEAYARGIVESSADCISTLSPDGLVLSINGSGRRLLELRDQSDLLGKKWHRLFSAADAEAARLAVLKAAAGDVARFQGQRPTATGTAKWWDVVVSPVRGAEGDVVRLLALSRDITARRTAELELQRLHDVERSRARRVEEICDLTSALAKATRVDEIGAVLVEHALPALGAGVCALSVHEGLARGFAIRSDIPAEAPDDPMMLLVGAANAGGEEMDVWRRYPLSINAPMADATRSGEPIELSNRDALIERYPAWAEFFGAYGVESLYAAPVQFAGRTLGGFVLLWRSQKSLDDGERTFIHALADQCGVALERARLYGEICERNPPQLAASPS